MAFAASPMNTDRGTVVVWTEGVETRLPHADWIAFVPATAGQLPFEAPMSRAIELATGCFLPEEYGVVAIRWPSAEVLEKLRALASMPALHRDIAPFKFEVVSQGSLWSRLFSPPGPDNRLFHIRGNAWDGTLHLFMRAHGEGLVTGNFALNIPQGAAAFCSEFAGALQSGAMQSDAPQAEAPQSATAQRASDQVDLRGECARIAERAVPSSLGYVDSAAGFEVVKLFTSGGTVELFVELDANPREPRWGSGGFAEKDIAHREEIMRLLSAAAK